MESEITYDDRTGKVVWRLDPDIAEVYAGEIGSLGDRTNDAGFRDDARALFDAVREAKRDLPL